MNERTYCFKQFPKTLELCFSSYFKWHAGTPDSMSIIYAGKDLIKISFLFLTLQISYNNLFNTVYENLCIFIIFA